MPTLIEHSLETPSVRVASPGSSPASSAAGASSGSFESRATGVLGELQRTVGELLESAPGETRRATDVERVFAVDHRLGWQIYQIAKASHPLAAVVHVPARVSMQKLLKSAAKKRVPAAVVQGVSDAYDEFEKLVEAEAGDRAEMEAMVSAYVPEVREKKDLAARQAAFKAMSQVRGLTMAADIMAIFLWPAADGRTVDRVGLSGELGLRRVRPNARIVLSSGDLSKPDSTLLTLDGTPIDGSDPLCSLLPQFSSSPPPHFDTQKRGNMIYHWVSGDDVGFKSAVDLVIADQRRSAINRYREPDGRTETGAFRVIDTPTLRMTLDLFVHNDLFPGVTPSLGAYNTVGRGLVHTTDDPTRENDRLDITQAIQPINGGTRSGLLTNARLAHVPRYTEMLEHVCSTKNWEISQFRGYRLDVPYPIYGAQYFVGFKLLETRSGA